ncbi:MAG: hypothetical protein CM15mP85_27130 [Rhodobacterales bacterium]|nr:MAG: hypothetical protein CM15mP85_27130 [Rhodobacterales bacterium]
MAIIVPGREKVPQLQQIESEIKLPPCWYKHPKKIIIVDQLPFSQGKKFKNIPETIKELFLGNWLLRNLITKSKV